MSLKQLSNSAYLWSLYGVAFALPLFPKQLPIIIVLALLSWFASDTIRTIPDRWKSLCRIQKWLLFIWPIFYLLHLLGLVHTSNFSFAGLDLGIKASFLFLVPMIVLKPLAVNVISNVFKTFIISLIVSVICNVTLSLIDYSKTGELHQLFGTYFSHFIHMGYYALYLIFGLAILIHFTVENQHKVKTGQVLGLSAITLLFLTAIFMTGSKMGFIVLISVFMMAMMYLLRRSANKKRSMVIIGALVVITLGFFFGTGHLKDRLSSVYDNTFNAELNVNSVESTMARRMTWDASWELIKSNPLVGVGTGDIKDELKETYFELGYIGPYELGLNSHSQFLQSFGALGFFGFFSIVLAFALLIVLAFKKHNFLVLAFSVAVFLSLITESMLEVQAGVVFVAFFYGVLSEWLFADPRIRT